MLNQLFVYIDSNIILPKTQFRFTSNYSCTTAVLEIVDDILLAIDAKELIVLILLNHSKAFDRLIIACCLQYYLPRY